MNNMKYKNMKIRTYGSEELSTAIQKKLFELGYSWNSGQTPNEAVTRYKAFGVYSNDCGYLSYDSYDAKGTFFYCENTSAEVTIDELMQMQPEKRETIKIGDSVYDKAELEEATKNLKPIK